MKNYNDSNFRIFHHARRPTAVPPPAQRHDLSACDSTAFLVSRGACWGRAPAPAPAGSSRMREPTRLRGILAPLHAGRAPAPPGLGGAANPPPPPPPPPPRSAPRCSMAASAGPNSGPSESESGRRGRVGRRADRRDSPRGERAPRTTGNRRHRNPESDGKPRTSQSSFSSSVSPPRPPCRPRVSAG